ncbi:hypothetical protein ACN4EE_03260 [Geminocystis sp. CENA526]|uniref:hypothetical protein n=1 Tax=Geminocystis sp. CENA526 TaxID=1355871 RepID=UPI003D6DD99A
MQMKHPLYDKEEFARLGDEIYENKLRQHIEKDNYGKIVAIDIQTGEFEIATDTISATRQLYNRLPDAQPWVVRIGYRAVHRFGARSLKDVV